MADYSERATQLPEARPVSNVTPANASLVESAGELVNLFTEAEKTGKQEAYAEQTRNNYFAFLGEATEEVRNIAKADKLSADIRVGKALSPEDEAFMKSHQEALNQNKAAYDQGFKRLRDFRLDEESRLRAAIRARPDLGDELRSISQKELGMDVYTASMKQFGEDLQAAQQAAESAQAAADKRVSNAQSRAKYFINDVGGTAANIYRTVDPAAPPESPNSIESADARYAATLEGNPALKTEQDLGAVRKSITETTKGVNDYISKNNLTDPAVMQSILSDPASQRAVTSELDTRITTLEQNIAATQSISTGAYKAEGDAIVRLAQQELDELRKLKGNFTSEGLSSFLEYQKNSETLRVLNASPAIANIVGDMVPKGATDADRAKTVATADTLVKRVTGNWSSANEYTTTVANSVQHVGNILLSETVRNDKLLPARAPQLGEYVSAVAFSLSNPYKGPDGRAIAPPMESIYNRQGTGFLNLVTQASDNTVRLYKQLPPDRQQAFVGGIADVANMYTKQVLQQAKASVPEDVKKYIGTFYITDDPKSLDRETGAVLGWVKGTPESVKQQYQATLDRIQYSGTGPNGMKLVRNMLKTMVAPESTTWFSSLTGG
jgi:hypothetical protein